METLITGQLAAFNQLYKEIDQIYHESAKSKNISDAALWLLYSLYESNVPYTQREFCALWHCPPQTINSALKNLEKQGLIQLDPISGNKKDKLVVLTEKGTELTQRVITVLVLAEQRAIRGLAKEERDQLLSLTRKYVELLQTEVNKISDPSSEGSMSLDK